MPSRSGSFPEVQTRPERWGLFAHFLGGLFVFQVAEPEACDQMYESLARLHSNYYKRKVSGPLFYVPSPRTRNDQ